jgi:hypothetical protein
MERVMKMVKAEMVAHHHQVAVQEKAAQALKDLALGQVVQR